MTIAPVIFIFFNRPDVTRRSFAAIRARRPSRLYLIADGPRPTRASDAERCRETRALVESMLDWPCEVTRDYSEINLGCGRRLSSGLTAAFAQLGEAIVVEDDVLPRPEFFEFCTTLLARFRHDPHVHAINGFNPLGRYAPRQGAFVPTVFNSIWGWASWQRAWKDYRFQFDGWSSSEAKQRIREHVASALAYHFFAHNFDHMLQGKLDTWDFQWTFSMLAQQKVALVSSVNLIENIGFSADATHTTNAEPYFSGLKTYSPVTTQVERATDRPDRLHDKLYADVIMSPSTTKISLARLAANFPVILRFLKQRQATA